MSKKGKELDSLYANGKMFRCLDEVRQAKEPTTYWGNWIVKGAIILASGYGGVSKTTFYYKLLTGLQEQGSFLGVAGKADIKVLYLDLESEDSLIKSRQNLLGNLQIDHPNFYYENIPNVTFKELKPYIDKFRQDVWEPDIIVIDPLSLAFPMENENSNAEATKQMNYLRDVMRDWEATLVLISHTGKMEIYGTGASRGASARPFLADIAWNFHTLGKEYDENLFIMHIPKNRWIHDEFFQCIQKQEGEFIPVDLPENFVFRPSAIGGLRTYQIQLKIEDLLKAGTEMTVAQMIELIPFGENMSHNVAKATLFRALTPLIQLGKADRVSRGVYKWAGDCVSNS